MSPFSASPPTVLPSGFKWSCRIFVKEACPNIEFILGFQQVIQFSAQTSLNLEEFKSMSSNIFTSADSNLRAGSSSVPLGLTVLLIMAGSFQICVTIHLLPPSLRTLAQINISCDLGPPLNPWGDKWVSHLQSDDAPSVPCWIPPVLTGTSQQAHGAPTHDFCAETRSCSRPTSHFPLSTSHFRLET